jgi:Fe-S cluster assembly scaffold IscU
VVWTLKWTLKQRYFKSILTKEKYPMAYHEKVKDHFENPRNFGSLNQEDGDVGTGIVGAPACGDVMKLQIRVNENGEITEVRFKTFGCGAAIASSSWISEYLEGKTLDEALQVKNTFIAEELALPPVKLHCSMLAEDAIKKAVSDFKEKQHRWSVESCA